MTAITIPSFQWWLSNDRNVGQEGAFWKSDGVEIRKNSQYVTLNRALRMSSGNNITFTSVWTREIVALAFEARTATANSNIMNELLAFCNQWAVGKIYDKAWMTYDLAIDEIRNFVYCNNKKYIIWKNNLFEFTNKTTVSGTLWALTTWISKRPALDFYWDLIFWDGTQVGRYNKDWTLVIYSTSIENPVIGGLDWTVYAITRIWPNVYVWCNDWRDTNLYVWDGLSSRPIQKITYAGKPIVNVAVLWAQHYWWSQKSVNSIKNVFIGESYQPTRYITSNVPNGLSSWTDNDENILWIFWTNTNAIETVNDMVYLPGYGRIFGFGKYFPNQFTSLNRDLLFDGSECTVMLAGYVVDNGSVDPVDCSNLLAIAYKDLSGNYQVGYYDFADYNGYYTSTWYIESLEYVSSWLVQWENQNKFILPIELTNSACTITVSVQRNRSWTYTPIKTITSADYWIGYETAELKDVGNWDVIQFRFDLATSDTNYSPKLRVGMTNQSSAVWNLARR